MTLANYIDNLEVKFQMGGWKKNEYPPPEFLRQAINTARRTIARETRCLQCWNTTTGDKDYGDYTLPTDCIMVLDVMYDNIPLKKKTNWTMNYLRRYDASGTPKYWSKYGGENQSTSFVYLHPRPNEDGKVIKLQTIQLPVVLSALNNTCELQPNIQALVEDALFTILAKYRGLPWVNLQSFLDKQIIKFINFRKI